MFLHLRSFEKIKISNFKNSDIIFVDKSNSKLKTFNYKVSLLFKTYDFYFDHLLIDIVVVTFFTNLIYLSYSSMKLYKRYMFCEQYHRT
jgi:hypothetical protein